jgi:surfeit locus 1 family protein
VSRTGAKYGFLLILCAAGLLLFTSLGIWQVERRAWKLDLIARVDARIHAPAVPPPPAAAWGRLDPREFQYRRVRVRGHFVQRSETTVDALTELGAGSWVLTPLQTSEGIVLVNRGFVPEAREVPGTPPPPAGEIVVTGLMRASEPGGRFLRPNQPSQGRWFSRDVAAIASARGLGRIAPFFIDADNTPNRGGLPVGGLTVVRFRNTHLIYALTWFGLAGLSLAGLVLLLRSRQEPS